MENIEKVYVQATQLHEKGQLAQAFALYKQVIALKPNHADALHRIGVIFHQNGQHHQAVACIGKAIEIGPDKAEYHCNLGSCFIHLQKPKEAEGQYKIALSLDPKSASVYQNMGVLMHQQDRYNDEIASYAKGRKFHPNNIKLLNELVKTKKDACDWDELDALNKQLQKEIKKEIKTTGKTTATAFHMLYTFDSFKDQYYFAKAYAKGRFTPLKTLRDQLAFSYHPRKGEKIRIGYVCSDFGNHPTGHLMRTMFEHHNRDRFEIFAYSLNKDDGSDYYKNISQSADHFVELFGMSIPDKAKRINADKIDILLDVMGYIQNSQSEIFALRPAPIQVSFLAYPGTMGAEFIDYLVTDSQVVHLGEEKYFTEKLLKMPDSYFVTDNQQKISDDVPSRAECGLPEEGFVFACFNKPYKITAQMFDLWAQILKQVPDSVLWLFSNIKDCEDNLKKEAEKRGFADRLVFAKREEKSQHLARHALADMFLDCFEINAHTTAIDALWAGLPVLTKPGNSIISRASASIINAMGMENWVVTSNEEYVEKAVYYATNPTKLSAEKKKLKTLKNKTALFDTAKYVKSLEEGFLQAYEQYKESQPPKEINVI